MSRGYVKIACAVGAIVRDRLRRTQPEPMPKRLAELLSVLSERDGGPSSGEHPKEEASARGNKKPR
jgi:hypothetical protein